MDKSLQAGLALLEKSKYEPVHELAIRLIHENTEDPTPYFLLARLAFDHRNLGKADELYRRALELDPKHPLFLAGFGQFLVSIGRQQQALELAEKAAEIPINDAFVADTVGVIYSRTGFHEKAVPLFEKAVRLNSAPPNFHYNLGASLQFSGDFEGAKSAYEQALERQPDAYRALSSLVSLSRQTEKDNRLPELKRQFSRQSRDPDARLHLGHAIAKTLEDLGDYPESLDWLGRAKQMKRKLLEYRIEDDLLLFTAAAKTFDGKATQNARHSDASPIFVIGLPRTGTTLVDRILSSHPDVTSAGELNTFAGLIKDLAGSTSNRVLDTETFENVLQEDLIDLGHSYIDATKKLARGAPRFTDKMPLNFFYAGLIHKALPNARIIALRRGATDSCLSNYRQLFSTTYSYYNYSFDLNDTAAYYRAFDELIAHWHDVLPRECFMQIRYEDIIGAQEYTTRALLSFCDLTWDDACLRFHENTAPVSTASSVQVRKPLYSDSIGRWRKYGGNLDELRKRLGVSDQAGSSSSGT